jgi:hypothetical protein
VGDDERTELSSEDRSETSSMWFILAIPLSLLTWGRGFEGCISVGISPKESTILYQDYDRSVRTREFGSIERSDRI